MPKKRVWVETFEELKGKKKNPTPRNLYPVKLSFKGEEEIKTQKK